MIAMRSKDRDKVLAFADYAYEAEGMRYTVTQHNGKAVAVPCGDYAPECVRAVVRHFKQDWKAFSY